MTDPTRLAEKVDRAERARKIVEDPLVAEAFASLEKQVVEVWLGTKGDESEERDRAYVMGRLIRNLKEHFEAQMVEGKAAKRRLLKIEEEGRMERLGRRIRRGQ